MRVCDICAKNAATLFESVVTDNKVVEYAYCEACYTRALKNGKNPCEEAKYRLSRKGKECDACGFSVEKFKDSFLFGCSECYSQMREIAVDSALRAQNIDLSQLSAHTPQIAVHSVCEMKGTNFDIDESRDKTGAKLLKSAGECTVRELVENNVVSSRIRLARNIRGLEFPKNLSHTDQRVVDLINGAFKATDGLFNARLYLMSRLTKEQKKALVERHVISLALANNEANGAVIVEGDKKYGVSVMINEEDHIREQCLTAGFDLKGAYEGLRAYDERLIEQLPVAYDEQLGFLTACPTNLGTGMRASAMLFLPALKRAGAIDDALKTFKNEFGLTIRGVFGEGSDSAYDMYQISNSRTLGVREGDIINQVEQAVVRMCYCERVALEKLVREKHTELLDGISRSYAVLKGAYSLSAQELMRLLVDVKLGVILGILPIKSTSKLDETIWSCTPSSLQIITKGNSDEERDKMRAGIVRRVLAEA